MMCAVGFETTADVHTVPAHVVRHSYGAFSVSSSPCATVVCETVGGGDLGDECDVEVVTGDHGLQDGSASIQHSDGGVIVPLSLPAPDHPTV